jgi:hypothetical protein
MRCLHPRLQVKPCLKCIAAAAVGAVGGGQAVARLLDVGTGAGALLPYFMAEVREVESLCTTRALPGVVRSA